jgi:hypothetical protein
MQRHLKSYNPDKVKELGKIIYMNPYSRNVEG